MTLMRGSIAALVAGVLVAASCGGSSETGEVGGGEPTSDQANLDEVPESGPLIDLVANVTGRNTSPGANGVAVDSIVDGTNQFAVEFFQAAVGAPTGNAVVGNYSLSTALLLTMAGTSGATADGFADVLGVGTVTPAELHPAVNAIDLILESRAGDGLDISTANKLFVRPGLVLRDEFLDIAVGAYGAPVASADFAGARDEVTAAVNGWVSEQTDGFIDHLTDGYSTDTVIVLANAMYLKAKWSVVFSRLPQPGPFTLADGTQSSVELMAHNEYLPLNEGADFVAVELPYAGGNLSLVVIQPDDLAAFESDLTAARLNEITGGLQESGIHLTMPIWSTKTSIEALDPLHAIGLPTVYDFDAMFEGGDSGYFIESISHVARIDVDETGTTAGAATDVAVAASHGPTIAIDRPFFYVIRDRGSGVFLFLGHVTNPAITD